MIACVRLPTFAARIEARGNPRFSTRPLLLMRHTPKGRAKVAACCMRAEAAGVVEGLPLAHALAVCPEAHVLAVSPARYRRALDELLCLLGEYSHWLEADKAALQTAWVSVDLGKLRPSDGRALAEDMLRRVNEWLFCDASLHNDVSIGLAANRFTAQVAALHAPGGTVRLIPRGEEADFLASLPVETLPLDAETARRLDLFGLRTLGQLAALPRNALVAQFGKPGALLHRLASGADARRVAKFVPPEQVCAAFQFADPVADCQIIQRVLGKLADDLARQMATRGLTWREVTLVVQLESGGQIEDHRHLRQPMQGQTALVRALDAALARLTLHRGVNGVEVLLGRLKAVVPKQLSLFEADVPDVSEVMLELITRYGDERFYTAALNPQASYLPELSYHLASVAVA